MSIEDFLENPFTDPAIFFLTTAAIFGVVFLRYLLVSGVYHYLLFSTFGFRFRSRQLNQPSMTGRQAKQEVLRSALTSLIFALSGMALLILWQHGFTQIYLEWAAFPWWYHPLSIVIALFLHETFYYWLHRWMHRPKIYRRVHKWHHESIETSSFTSFSFHPIESLLQALVIPLFVLFLPLHIYSLFFLLFLMTISGTLNHASVEVFPRGFEKHWLGKWLIGATHHDLHHKEFRFNFGLYFTFWDKWMGTESPHYEETFRKYTK